VRICPDAATFATEKKLFAGNIGLYNAHIRGEMVFSGKRATPTQAPLAPPCVIAI